MKNMLKTKEKIKKLAYFNIPTGKIVCFLFNKIAICYCAVTFTFFCWIAQRMPF